MIKKKMKIFKARYGTDFTLIAGGDAKDAELRALRAELKPPAVIEPHIAFRIEDSNTTLYRFCHPALDGRPGFSISDPYHAIVSLNWTQLDHICLCIWHKQARDWQRQKRELMVRLSMDNGDFADDPLSDHEDEDEELFIRIHEPAIGPEKAQRMFREFGHLDLDDTPRNSNAWIDNARKIAKMYGYEPDRMTPTQMANLWKGGLNAMNK